MKKNFLFIVPAYRSEKILNSSIRRFTNQLNQLHSDYVDDWEVIVVIDGKTKGASFKPVKSKKVKVLSYLQNQGKGFALRYGIEHSDGSYILFVDVDGDIPIRQIANFFPYLSTNDIVIGSKRHPFSKINYPLIRRILSKGFQLSYKLILGVNLKDTQSGLKIIKREVFDVVNVSLKMNRFSFDVELCFLAQKHGFHVVEAPINIEFQSNIKSTVKLLTPIRMLLDIFYIRYLYSIKGYYQKEFHKKKFQSLDILNKIKKEKKG